MTFRCERIPESGNHVIDMKKLNSVNSAFTKPTHWVVNNERDIYVFPLGGGIAEIPCYFGINFHGEIITFEAYRNGEGSIRDGIMLSYKIIDIHIPKAILQHKDEIKIIISSSLDIYGFCGNRSQVSSVSIEFEKNI